MKNSNTVTQPIRGYKVTNPDGKCKDFLFEAGKEYKHDGPIKICSSGFHFCIKAAHCFSYYSFDSANMVFEVESLGVTQSHDEDSKICTDHIRIIRQLTWDEVLTAANEGKGNSGHSNSGYSNSGSGNSGAFCTGDAPFPLFNKVDKAFSYKEFINSLAYSLLCNNVDTKLWVPFCQMTDEEKTAFPKSKTTDGYLKDIPFKEAFQNAWHNWNATNRSAFTSLPNFDAAIFEEITGVKVKSI